MALLTQWTWVWISSGIWWWTGKPGVLQSMGSQRVRHDWATELDWTELNNGTFSLKVHQRGRVPWGRPLCIILITKQKLKSKKQLQLGVRIGSSLQHDDWSMPGFWQHDYALWTKGIVGVTHCVRERSIIIYRLPPVSLSSFKTSLSFLPMQISFANPPFRPLQGTHQLYLDIRTPGTRDFYGKSQKSKASAPVPLTSVSRHGRPGSQRVITAGNQGPQLQPGI